MRSNVFLIAHPVGQSRAGESIECVQKLINLDWESKLESESES